MKCLNCPLEVVPDGKAYVHVNGLYRCDVVGEVKYAEPSIELKGLKYAFGVDVGNPQGDVQVEKKFCRCAAAAVGSCENCQTPLCAGCDSEEFVDVLCCRDKGACEKALRRKAVASTSRELFGSSAHLGATEAV